MNLPPYNVNHPARIDNDRILDCIVQQVSSNTGQYQSNGQFFYEEKWKGPTTWFKRYKPSSGQLVVGPGSTAVVTWTMGKVRPTITASEAIRYYQPPPTLDPGWVWVVDNLKTEDVNPAGDHTILTVKYKCVVSSDGEGGNVGAASESKITWKITWGDRGSTVLEYLDPTKDGTNTPKAILNMPVVTGYQRPTDPLKTVPAVKSWANKSTHSEKYATGEWQFIKGANRYEIENEQVQKVADYYVRGVNPHLHYPIITKITRVKGSALNSLDSESVETLTRQEGDVEGTVTSFNKFTNMKTTVTTEFIDENTKKVTTKSQNQVGNFIDYVDNIVGNPFTFDTTYEWLKVDDSVEVTDANVFEVSNPGPGGQTVTGYQTVIMAYTRTETWWGEEMNDTTGGMGWDKNFYGNRPQRWEFQSIPTNVN